MPEPSQSNPLSHAGPIDRMTEEITTRLQLIDDPVLRYAFALAAIARIAGVIETVRGRGQLTTPNRSD